MVGNGNKAAGKGAMRRRLRAPLTIGLAAAVGLALSPTVTSAFSSGFDMAPVSLAARGGIGSLPAGRGIAPRLVDRGPQAAADF